MLPLNGSRLTGFMKCVETWSGSERQLATLCKENHSSNFHTFTDSKSHFIHLCCNDWISWPVLSAFVLSGGRMECSWMEKRAVVLWDSPCHISGDRQEPEAWHAVILMCEMWSSCGTLGTKHPYFHLNCVPGIQLEEIRLSLVAESMYIITKNQDN